MNARAPYLYFFYTPFGETILQEDAFSASYDNPWRFNGKELDPETGNYYYGARYYNPKWSVWLSVDPLAHDFYSTSPYVVVANNPVIIIDPDGNDTLVMHRSNRLMNMEDGASDIYMVTFSVIRKGVEEKIGGEFYMLGNSEHSKNPINGLRNKNVYTLKYMTMEGQPNWRETINVYGTNVYIHRGNQAGELEGCYVLSETKPYLDEGAIWPNNYFAPRSEGALGQVQLIYQEANGGENGSLLTGEMFILRTNSKANENLVDLRYKELPSLIQW